MKFVTNKVILASLLVALTGACSSDDKADRELVWPDLSDIAPVPARMASEDQPESVIRALREEAERRKSEGYQPPEAAPDPAGN